MKKTVVNTICDFPGCGKYGASTLSVKVGEEFDATFDACEEHVDSLVIKVRGLVPSPRPDNGEVEPVVLPPALSSVPKAASPRKAGAVKKTRTVKRSEPKVVSSDADELPDFLAKAERRRRDGKAEAPAVVNPFEVKDAPAAASKPKSDRVNVSDVRDWLRAQGRTVSDRGRLSSTVIAEYLEATAI